MEVSALEDLINPEKARRAALYAIVLIVANMAQNLVFSRVAVMGVHPMFLPLFAVAVGMFEGGVWGGVFGLALGLLADMTFAETTVLFTILFPLFGFCTGMLVNFSINKRLFSYVCISFAALAITAGAQAASPLLVSPEHTGEIMLVALGQVLLSLPFAPALYFPVKAIAAKNEET